MKQVKAKAVKKAQKKAVQHVVKVPAPDVTPGYEFITPIKAEKLLEANKSNRSLRTGVAEKYAFDMKNGAWTTCTAPVVIYDDGEVADGQHRLWALVESGTGQWFMILRGLDRKSGLNIDTGLGRNLVDNARISGVDPDLSISLISTCRGIAE